MDTVTTKEVAQQFATALELLLDWIDQRTRKSVSQAQGVTPISMDRLLRVEDVAKILNISKAHAYNLIERKEVPSIRFGQSVRVRVQDLQDLMEKLAKG